MKSNHFITHLLLYPLSKIYGAVVRVRNWLFDAGFIKPAVFTNVPVIVVGNLAVGGTGKTPHVEYLIKALGEGRKIAVLSRGYKRKTKGFVLATPQSRPEDIGDESYQIYRKFSPSVMVGVCERRAQGIREMLEIDPGIEMFILDDAFQHRYVKPRVSILLTEYKHPFFNDSMLPLGRLREQKSAYSRAEIIVATKCPDRLNPIDYRTFRENIGMFPFQQLFFSRYAYGHLMPVFPDQAHGVPILDDLTPADAVLCVTGIANPGPFRRYLRSHAAAVTPIRFPDHHRYTAADMAEIENAFNALEARQRYILTTEKDAVRLFNSPYFPHKLKQWVFYVPVSVEFLPGAGDGDFVAGVEKALRYSGQLFK